MGLRARVMAALMAVLLASGGAAWWVTSLRLRRSVDAALGSRAKVIGEALSASIDVSLALKLGKNPETDALLARLIEADREIAYILVVKPDGTPVSWRSAAGARSLDTPEQRAALVAAHEEAKSDLVRVSLTLDREAAGEASEEEKLLGLEAKDQTARGRALIALDPAVPLNRMHEFFATSYLLAGLAAVAILWIFFDRLFQRMARLKDYASRVGGGDLTQRHAEAAADELGALSKALETISQNFGDTIGRVRSAVFELDSVSSGVAKAARQIAEDATGQATSVRQTVQAVGSMSKSAASLEQELTSASSAAETSATQLRSISQAIARVSGTVHDLAQGVGRTRQHLTANATSLAEVEQAVDSLSQNAESTAAATTQISASIRSVEQTSATALARAHEAREKAASGATAVKAIVDSIKRIRQASGETAESIRSLAARVEAIRHILKVIDDIANQTNLLSLNASIIASQAGEHGRGFGVVAGEIKALAQKTAGSTREIGDVVQEILTVSEGVLASVSHAVRAVDEGVQRSHHADRALTEILATANETGTLVRTIAHAMAEQASSTQHVDQAVQDVNTITQRVRQIVTGRKDEAEELKRAILDMQENMQHAMTTVNDQASQVEHALAAISEIFEQIRRISAMKETQDKSRVQVAKALELLESLSVRHRASADSLGAVVRQVTAQSQRLIEGVQVFRV